MNLQMQIDKMPNVISLRVNIRTKSMLSITLCKKCCFIKSDSSSSSLNKAREYDQELPQLHTTVPRGRATEN